MFIQQLIAQIKSKPLQVAASILLILLAPGQKLILLMNYVGAIALARAIEFINRTIFRPSEEEEAPVAQAA
ncbi:MAG: hypothetical protein ACOH5I_17215 [Oligoflexus sp.]